MMPFSAMDDLSDRLLARSMWLLPLFHGFSLLGIVVFAGVVGAFAVFEVAEPPAPEGAADMILVPGILTAIHIASPLPALLVCSVMHALVRRIARKVASGSCDPDERRLLTARAVWNQSIVWVVAPEMIASVGLIVCLLNALSHAGHPAFYLNAASAPVALLCGLKTFPTRSRRQHYAERFEGMVREEQDALEAGAQGSTG